MNQNAPPIESRIDLPSLFSFACGVNYRPTFLIQASPGHHRPAQAETDGKEEEEQKKKKEEQENGKKWPKTERRPAARAIRLYYITYIGLYKFYKVL